MPARGGSYRIPRIKIKNVAGFKRPNIPGLQRTAEKQPWETPPAGFPGSGAEYAVYWALVRLKVDFQFQQQAFGGRSYKGGQVLDFFIPSTRTVIRVQGIHWHYERGSAQTAADQIARLALEGQGYTVVDIDEDMALKNPLYYVREALRGIDHSRGFGR